MKINHKDIWTIQGEYQSSHIVGIGDIVTDCKGLIATVVDINQRNYLPRFLLRYEDGHSKWRGKTKLRTVVQRAAGGYSTAPSRRPNEGL